MTKSRFAFGTQCQFRFVDSNKTEANVLLVPLITKPEPALELTSRIEDSGADELSALLPAALARDDVGLIQHTTQGGRYKRLVLIGLGNKDKLDAARIRSAAAAAMRWLMAEKIQRVAICTDGLAVAGVDSAVADWTTGMTLSGFRFLPHRNGDVRPPETLKVAFVSGAKRASAISQRDIDDASIIASAVNYARSIAHQPANVINPATLAAEARALARAARLNCTVFDERALRRMKANGILSVGVGADPGPCLIRLDYRAAPRSKAVTVIVGKAVTFDTGGYSIKPAQGMEAMKFDKCGGTAVLGVMKAVSELRLKCNVTGLIAAAENAISEKAYRPADIIRMMSGKTVEIISTDAEGRMVLADALWYAQRHCSPTALIDLATLTGGVSVALGRCAAGIMSNDDELAADLGESGRRTHERLWRLPLWDDYRELIRGTDSDIRNSGNSRDAHAIVGGMFLKEFVENGTPWAHLDIAGVATQDNIDGVTGKGATGFGVRLLVDFLRRRSSSA